MGCEAFSANRARQNPDYAFTFGQITDHPSSDNGVVTLNVWRVDLPDALIDSGSTCNLMGQKTRLVESSVNRAV